MAKRRIDYGTFTPGVLTILSNKLGTSASVVYRGCFGLTATECRVILLLAGQPGIPAQRISAVIGFDKGLVSRTVHHLAEMGLVAPQDSNRRPLLELTAAGFEMHDKIIKVALKREKLLLTGFSKSEAATLTSMLRRIGANLQLVWDFSVNEAAKSATNSEDSSEGD